MPDTCYRTPVRRPGTFCISVNGCIMPPTYSRGLSPYQRRNVCFIVRSNLVKSSVIAQQSMRVTIIRNWQYNTIENEMTEKDVTKFIQFFFFNQNVNFIYKRMNIHTFNIILYNHNVSDMVFFFILWLT